jgi:internalin A
LANIICKVTDAGVEMLKFIPGLKQLDLSFTEVAGAGLEPLKGLTALRELQLSDPKVTENGIRKLREALPYCVIWTEHGH